MPLGKIVNVKRLFFGGLAKYKERINTAERGSENNNSKGKREIIILVKIIIEIVKIEKIVIVKVIINSAVRGSENSNSKGKREMMMVKIVEIVLIGR